MNVRLRTYRDTGTQNEVIGAVPVYVDVRIQILVIYQFISWTIGLTTLAAQKIIISRSSAGQVLIFYLSLFLAFFPVIFTYVVFLP